MREVRCRVKFKPPGYNTLNEPRKGTEIRYYQPVSGLDVRRVAQGTPRKLRESVSELVDSLRLHLESALLGHRGVKAKKAPRS